MLSTRRRSDLRGTRRARAMDSRTEADAAPQRRRRCRCRYHPGPARSVSNADSGRPSGGSRHRVAGQPQGVCVGSHARESIGRSVAVALPARVVATSPPGSPSVRPQRLAPLPAPRAPHGGEGFHSGLRSGRVHGWIHQMMLAVILAVMEMLLEVIGLFLAWSLV